MKISTWLSSLRIHVLGMNSAVLVVCPGLGWCTPRRQVAEGDEVELHAMLIRPDIEYLAHGVPGET
jgi:hypothetical protein